MYLASLSLFFICRRKNVIVFDCAHAHMCVCVCFCVCLCVYMHAAYVGACMQPHVRRAGHREPVIRLIISPDCGWRKGRRRQETPNSLYPGEKENSFCLCAPPSFALLSWSQEDYYHFVGLIGKGVQDWRRLLMNGVW